MSIVERILEKQQSRRKRLDAARDAISRLSPDERDEILAELIEAVETQHVAPPVAASVPTAAPNVGNGTMSVKAMIIETMHHAEAPLRTHEIYLAARERYPDADINKNTVAAAVHRLSTQDPPLLVQRGSDPRGPMYSIDESALSARNGTLGIQ